MKVKIEVKKDEINFSKWPSLKCSVINDPKGWYERVRSANITQGVVQYNSDDHIYEFVLRGLTDEEAAYLKLAIEEQGRSVT